MTWFVKERALYFVETGIPEVLPLGPSSSVTNFGFADSQVLDRTRDGWERRSRGKLRAKCPSSDVTRCELGLGPEWRGRWPRMLFRKDYQMAGVQRSR